MEAVPRLHMLRFPSKISPEGTSFANLKRYIAEFYQEDPEAYAKEIVALETLRNQAVNSSKDKYTILKRYYCQLHSLQNRFPKLRELATFNFTWKSLFRNRVQHFNNISFEQAIILYNTAAAHTQAGAAVTRDNIDGMKLACTHFQCAAWIYEEIKERYASSSAINSSDQDVPDILNIELLVFMRQLSLAQAQECILEKSLIDNRKPSIVAKVTAQIIIYYGAALAALITGGDDGPVRTVVDSSVYKLWKKYVLFKISYLNCILYLYQGQQAEEQKKMGECVTLYEAAWEKLEEARKESSNLPNQSEIKESLIFTADVVEAKRKNANNENKFIYHEPVPELNTLTAIQGANLVHGISFSVTDPDIMGEDIFARLVPMKAHEASSLYSEEKAKLLRKYSNKIEEKDAHLETFMNSLSIENLNINEEKTNKIPQGIVDRCATLNAKKNAIPDLEASMAQLTDICTDVNANLQEIGTILSKEDKEEKEFQQLSGVQRTPNAHITELAREYQKYNEAHQKARESNETLCKAIEMHINNLKILSKPLKDIQVSVPKLSSELNTVDVFQDVKLIVNKVNEMKAQRLQFYADLRIAVNEDDITSKIINHGSEESYQALFNREIAKHERLTQLIDQNLMAQDNILKALTEAYAKAAPILRTLTDVKHKREAFFTSLAASYDVYEDLLSKSGKGLEFYMKLAGNVQKLFLRCKSARDVQSEERQQRLLGVSGVTNVNLNSNVGTTLSTTSQITQSVPKLRVYLKNKIDGKGFANMQTGLGTSSLPGNQFIPSIRPNPLGSETPNKVFCQQTPYYVNPTIANTNIPPVVGPNEPPPPYSLQQISFHGQQAAPSGYNSQMFLPYHQNIAPPAYKPQASPNSQFLAMGGNMTAMNTMQIQQQPSVNYTPILIDGQNSFHAPSANPQQSKQFPAQDAFTNVQSNQNVTTASNMCIIPQVSALQPNSVAQVPTIPSQASSYQANANTFQATLNKAQPIYVSTQTPQVCLSYQYINSSLGQPLQVPRNTLLQQPSTMIQTQNTVIQSAMPIPSMTLQNINRMGDTLPAQQQLNVSGIKTPHMLSNSGPSTSNYTTQSFDSSSMHPGYMYNAQTGKYDYGSGFLQQSLKQVSSHYSLAPQSYAQTRMQQQNTGLTTSSVFPDKNMSANNSTVPFVPEGGIISHTALNNANMPMQLFSQNTNNGNKVNDGNTKVIYYNASNNDKISSAYYKNYGDQQQTTHASMSTSNNVTNTMSPIVPVLQTYNPPQLLTKDNGNSNNSSFPTLHSNDTQCTYTYIQSGTANAAKTDTTKSGDEYATSAEQVPKQLKDLNTASTSGSQHKISHETPSSSKMDCNESIIPKGSNIDLLSDMDYSAIESIGMKAEATKLPEPTLKPKVVNTNLSPKSTIVEGSPNKTPSLGENLFIQPKTDSENIVSNSKGELTSKELIEAESEKMKIDETEDNKTGNFNLDIIDSFQWYNDMLADDGENNKITQPIASSTVCTFSMVPNNPFTDDKVLKCFHKDVERYEKLIESLNVKMLNGHTPLSAKWKELQDLLERDANLRSTTVGRLFPDKNRSSECLPFDQARVRLEKNTDDYINAGHIRNLGAGCPNIIIAQTPQSNTNNDFWFMVWTQKASTILCLHPPGEMFDPFWPQNIEGKLTFDDFTIRCVNTSSLSNCEQFHLTISMLNSEDILELTVLQLKKWLKNTPSLVVRVADDAISAHQMNCKNRNSSAAPLIINCLTGSERSGLVSVAICAILATQQERPLLINVVDVWHRICSQRQSSLRDLEMFEQSMHIVLNHAHDVLNKNSIVTSYQMKIAPQVTEQEKQATKDPLNELDALWKLK